jgi:hypothetical protein
VKRTTRRLHALLKDPRTGRLLNTHSSELSAADVEAKAELLALGTVARVLGEYIDALGDEDDLIEIPLDDGETVRAAMGVMPSASA